MNYLQVHRLFRWDIMSIFIKEACHFWFLVWCSILIIFHLQPIFILRYMAPTVLFGYLRTIRFQMRLSKEKLRFWAFLYHGLLLFSHIATEHIWLQVVRLHKTHHLREFVSVWWYTASDLFLWWVLTDKNTLPFERKRSSWMMDLWNGPEIQITLVKWWFTPLLHFWSKESNHGTFSATCGL